MFVKNELPYAKVLKEFGWLGDLYALDYYIEQHWHRLPQSWQNHFDECVFNSKKNLNTLSVQMVKFVESLLQPNKCFFDARCGPFPLSLIALKSCVLQLSINRRSIRSKNEIESKIFHDCRVRFYQIISQIEKLRKI